jgi:hypothetical protein
MYWLMQAYWLAVADFWTVKPAPEPKTARPHCVVIDFVAYRSALNLPNPKDRAS